MADISESTHPLDNLDRIINVDKFNRCTDRGKLNLARDPVTKSLIDAGRRLIDRKLGPPDDTEPP